jgi:hypothetical protein
MVKLTPSSVSTSRTASLTAVSGSHMPGASVPKRWRKSARPQRTWVRMSRSPASGRIMWFQAWAMPPPPARWPSRIRAYTSGWWCSSHDIRVGPALKERCS